MNYYTDSAYWRELEGDFDERNTDEWDVDMQAYYGGGNNKNIPVEINSAIIEAVNGSLINLLFQSISFIELIFFVEAKLIISQNWFVCV